MSDDNSQDRLEDDDDFDFKNKNNKSDGDELKTQKIENQHMDEAVELDSEGSEEIQSQEEENQDQEDEEDDEQVAAKKSAPIPQKASAAGKQQALKRDDDDDEAPKTTHIPGAYDPADYASLDVTPEIKELFKYIQRYNPETKELDSKFKPFIPEYYPAVGEVDAYIKMPRPDAKEESLGINILDEPSLNQSNRAVLIMIYKDLFKIKDDKLQEVHNIPNAEKNPKEVQKWINSVADIRKTKQPHSVSYSNKMPDIDELLQVWPQEIEDALQGIKIPSEEIDLTLEDYCKFACAVLDIPVHASPNKKSNVIESMHVLFTLYSEFKSNIHFMQKKSEGQQYDQMQLQIN